ncbi:MAG: AsmA family protein [Planctomycetota bacterium]|jgi:hypothetical protein
MKLILKLGLVLVVLVILAVGAVFFYMDRMAREAIERGSTYALGVETTVGRADIKVLSGALAVSGLRVTNPEGFDQEHFLTLGQVDVAVSLGTLRQEMVELPSLALSHVDVSLEKRGKESNYGVILANLKRFESKETEPQDEAPGRGYVIREVVISDVKIGVDLLPIGGQLTHLDVPIDQIRLSNVGTETDRGMLLSELSGVLLKAILAATVNKAGDLIPADVLGDLTGRLAELTSLSDLGIDATVFTGDQAINFAEKILGEAGQTIGESVQEVGGLEDVPKKVGEELGKTVEGLGGLLGDKKDDDGDQ